MYALQVVTKKLKYIVLSTITNTYKHISVLFLRGGDAAEAAAVDAVEEENPVAGEQLGFC